MEIILASASPRRAQLLNQVGIPFRAVPSLIEEGQPCRPWSQWVQGLSRAKALSVTAGEGQIVLGADTIVICRDKVLGKPGDKEEAQEMLASLAGTHHEVMTGICLVNYHAAGYETYQDVEITRVHFRSLTADEIKTYAASGEPLDKAGAYGIQGLGALLVEKIEGCYFNVVGLPLVKTMQLLRRCGVTVLGG